MPICGYRTLHPMQPHRKPWGHGGRRLKVPPEQCSDFARRVEQVRERAYPGARPLSSTRRTAPLGSLVRDALLLLSGASGSVGVEFGFLSCLHAGRRFTNPGRHQIGTDAAAGWPVRSWSAGSRAVKLLRSPDSPLSTAFSKLADPGFPLTAKRPPSANGKEPRRSSACVS